MLYKRKVIYRPQRRSLCSCRPMLRTNIIVRPIRGKPSISPLTGTVSKAFLTLNRPFCRPIRSLNSQTAIKNYIFSKTIPKCSNKQASSFILCCWRCVNSQRPSAAISGKKMHLMTRALHYMSDNRDLSLSDIAAQFNISEEHFCRVFKEYTGYRPFEYLNLVKLQKAKELLKNTSALNRQKCVLNRALKATVILVCCSNAATAVRRANTAPPNQRASANKCIKGLHILHPLILSSLK